MKPVNEMTKDEAKAEMARLQIKGLEYRMTEAESALDRIEGLTNLVKSHIAGIRDEQAKLVELFKDA